MTTNKQHVQLTSQRGGALGKRGAKRTGPEREADIILEARMYLEGYSQKEIADHICDIRHYNISAQQVSQDMKKVRTRWLDSQLRDFDAAKAQELSKIDNLEREYWEAWRKSLKKAEEIYSEKEEGTVQPGDAQGKPAGPGKPIYSKSKVKKKETQTFGEPRYLEGIRWCIDKRCKIFGLDAPSKVNINWRDEARMAGIDPDKFENELVEQFVSAAKKGQGAEKPPTD
jgi:hypothetical protein